MKAGAAWDDLPPVLFDEDVCELLDMSPRLLYRRRQQGAFPIPELPSIDRKRRYSRADVVAFLERRTGARGRG